MPLVSRVGENRRTETPNAVMTTLASPTIAGSRTLSLWKVEMQPGASGPVHTFDSEQLWTVIQGHATVRISDEVVDLRTGDTIVIPGGAERRIEAPERVELLVCGQADAVVTAAGEPEPRGTPEWVR